MSNKVFGGMGVGVGPKNGIIRDNDREEISIQLLLKEEKAETTMEFSEGMFGMISNISMYSNTEVDNSLKSETNATYILLALRMCGCAIPVR